MARRYFTRVLTPFGNYRPDLEVCLDEKEFDGVKGKGLVKVLYEEHDGKRVDVTEDAGAGPAPAKAKAPTPAEETVPLDTLDEEEREIILKRRAGAAKKKADDDAKAAAAADKKKKDEADAAEKAAKKKADDDAKAAAKK